MNPTPSPPDPDSATIAGWKSRFAPASPTAILAGWFAVTRVEVLVRTSVLRPLTTVALAALRALQISDLKSPAAVARLLHLGESRTATVIDGLINDALIERGTSLILTDAGRTAVKTGELLASVPVRRTVAFREGAIVPLPESWGLKPLGLSMETDPRAAVKWVRDSGFNLADGNWNAVACVRADWLPFVVASFDGPPRADVFLAELPEWTVPPDPCCSLDGERAGVAFAELKSSEVQGPVVRIV